jgi:hypothetical protein
MRDKSRDCATEEQNTDQRKKGIIQRQGCGKEEMSQKENPIYKS